MKVTEAEFVQGFIRMCDDGYALGFHERNGGNASYRMKPEEVEQVKDQFSYDKEFTDIGTEVPDLAGEYFLVNRFWKIFQKCSISTRKEYCDRRDRFRRKTVSNRMGTCRRRSTNK